MGIQVVEVLTRIWKVVNGEDKQGLARQLLEDITYDPSTRQIVDF